MEIVAVNKHGSRITKWNIERKQLTPAYLEIQVKALPIHLLSFEGYGNAVWLGNGQWRVLTRVEPIDFEVISTDQLVEILRS